MAAIILFNTGGFQTNINNLSGSGLSFFGSNGAGYSIPVGSYNGRTFITDSTGTNFGPEGNNNQYLNSSGVVIGQTGSGILLQRLPNYMTTLNIHLNNATAVQTQNAKLYGYDRINPNNAPSGVTLYGYQTIHANQPQDLTGSGLANWTQLAGSGSYLTLTCSPGYSGLYVNGPNTISTDHDWYIALSASPNTVGAKTFGVYFYVEYM